MNYIWPYRIRRSCITCVWLEYSICYANALHRLWLMTCKTLATSSAGKKIDAQSFLLRQRRTRVWGVADFAGDIDQHDFNKRMKNTLDSMAGEELLNYNDVFDTSIPKQRLKNELQQKNCKRLLQEPGWKLVMRQVCLTYSWIHQQVLKGTMSQPNMCRRVSDLRTLSTAVTWEDVLQLKSCGAVRACSNQLLQTLLPMKRLWRTTSRLSALQEMGGTVCYSFANTSMSYIHHGLPARLASQLLTCQHCWLSGWHKYIYIYIYIYI